VLEDIGEAVVEGVSIRTCCEALNLPVKTYYRWVTRIEDRRKGAQHPCAHALSEDEKAEIVAVCCSERFVDANPYEIVAILEEEGRYLASPRTFYRILKERGLLAHRSSSRPPRKTYRPPELKATGPDQVYSWDITWLPSTVAGRFWYAYSVIDVWSREIVGWAIYDAESEVYAQDVFCRIKTKRNLKGTWLHADNGNPMRGATFAVMMANLGMLLSHSRPLVKNDNPYIESFFKTLKYTVGYPRKFESVEAARIWMADFMDWYNTKHRHSGIGFVTPEQRRLGQSQELFEKRNKTLLAAWKKHPHRFPKKGPRLWVERQTVYLNPSDDTRKFLYQKAG
jgi:transposase InsO family protein